MESGRDRWRRSWWFLLTLVPLGLFVPIVFGVAGARAHRRDWTAWAALYGLVFWGAVTLGAIEDLEHPALGRVVGVVELVAMPAAAVHALVIRRAYLEAIAEPPDPRLVRYRQARRAAFWLRVGGLGGMAFGMLHTIRSDLEGLAVLLMGVGIFLMGSLIEPATTASMPVTGPAPGTGEPGLVFRYVASNRLLVSAMLASLALGLAGAAVSSSDVADRAVMGFGSALTIAWLVTTLRPKERALALTAKGLHDSRGAGSFVPWDAIESLFFVELAGGNLLVGLTVADRASIRVSRLDRFLMPFLARTHGDLSFSPRALRVEPEWLIEVVDHYRQNPGERRELGSHRAVERFEEITRSYRPISAPGEA